MQAYFWLLVCVLLIAIEMATMGLTTIWFAVGSLGAYITALLGGGILLQLVVLILISLVMLLFTRPVVVKYLQARTKTNVEGMAGKVAVITEPVNNLSGQGAAKVSGLIWTARSTDDNVTFSIDELAEIVSVKGNKLIIKKYDGGIS